MIQHNDHLQQIFGAAVNAVRPENLIPPYLELNARQLRIGQHVFAADQFRNIYVAGAGKATASMAVEVEKILKDRITAGVIAVKEGHLLPLQRIRAIEAGHPLPNANSVVAAKEVTALLQKADKNDLVIFLLSGGASALLTDLPPGCSLQDLHDVFSLLLNSGAAIEEMNTVRKHLSGIKGGQLAGYAGGATIITLIISDVIGNSLSVIGSGPTVPDDSTFQDTLNIIDKYILTEKLPSTILQHLNNGLIGLADETPKSGDALFRNTFNYIIGDNRKALEAAEAQALQLGYKTRIVTDSMQGDAEETAIEWVRMITTNVSDKSCLIAGGETTVEVRGNGLGGRNQQLALAAAMALKGNPAISLLAAGTDGTDGPTDAAGAIVTPAILGNARHAGIDPESYLKNNDAYHFFEKTGGLLKTGPTQTNVMDLLVCLIDPALAPKGVREES